MHQFIGCSIEEKIQDIIDEIVNSYTGQSVLRYITQYRENIGDNIKQEEIEAQYKEFLKDLIYCWAEDNCVCG